MQATKLQQHVRCISRWFIRNSVGFIYSEIRYRSASWILRWISISMSNNVSGSASSGQTFEFPKQRMKGKRICIARCWKIIKQDRQLQGYSCWQLQLVIMLMLACESLSLSKETKIITRKYWNFQKVNNKSCWCLIKNARLKHKNSLNIYAVRRQQTVQASKSDSNWVKDE